MALLDLLGRSWSLGALWQICEHGPLSFRALMARCEGVSPSVLNTRLKELRRAEFIELTDDGYAATALGREVFSQLAPLRPLSHRWAARLRRR